MGLVAGAARGEERGQVIAAGGGEQHQQEEDQEEAGGGGTSHDWIGFEASGVGRLVCDSWFCNFVTT